MINHARTLLLNVSGSQRASPETFVGEEYVPPSFVAVALTPTLQLLRAPLFGLSADRAMLNYRLAQYMTLLHATDLADYVTYFDPRVTYWPSTDTVATKVLLPPKVDKLDGTVKNLQLIGNTRHRTDHEQLLLQWKITVASVSNVSVEQLMPYKAAQTIAYTTNGSMSQPVTLPGITEVSFVFETGVGSKWQVEIMRKPATSLSDILTTLDTVYVSAIEELFGQTEEPYLSFKKIWANRYQSLSHRLGAVLLGIIYRTNDLLLR